LASGLLLWADGAKMVGETLLVGIVTKETVTHFFSLSLSPPSTTMHHQAYCTALSLYDVNHSTTNTIVVMVAAHPQEQESLLSQVAQGISHLVLTDHGWWVNEVITYRGGVRIPLGRTVARDWHGLLHQCQALPPHHAPQVLRELQNWVNYKRPLGLWEEDVADR